MFSYARFVNAYADYTTTPADFHYMSVFVPRFPIKEFSTSSQKETQKALHDYYSALMKLSWM